MVRHYVPKRQAQQVFLWSSYAQNKSYEPTFTPEYPDAPVEPEVLGLIYDSYGEGKTAGSREEYRVSQGLKYFDIPFRYQYSIAGGRRLAGGQVIDFLCETVPTPTLIYVQGGYWHTGTKGEERQLQIANAVSYFNNEVRVVELWDYEIPDIDSTIARIKERVM